MKSHSPIGETGYTKAFSRIRLSNTPPCRTTTMFSIPWRLSPSTRERTCCCPPRHVFSVSIWTTRILRPGVVNGELVKINGVLDHYRLVKFSTGNIQSFFAEMDDFFVI